VRRYRHAPVTLVAPHGDLDYDTVPALRCCLTAAVARRTDVLLDLSEVTLLDCACLGTVLTAHHAATAVGRTITLVAPRPLVSYVLDITGADTVLPVIGNAAPCTDREFRPRRPRSG
jgi:anti-anti-sigma factor